MMTGQEVRQLTEHLEDMPEAEDAEDLSHVRSTSDAVSTAALEAAPRGPWHLETASAKPKMSRKLAPHLSRMSIQVLLQVLRRHLTKIVLLCLGAGTVTELSRLGRRLSSRMTCHMNHSLGCLNGANKLRAARLIGFRGQRFCANDQVHSAALYPREPSGGHHSAGTEPHEVPRRRAIALQG